MTAMSNEQLVALIKSGNTDLYETLWKNVERFVEVKAHDFAMMNEQQDSIDDMMQEAFLVLPSAVDYYDEERGKSFAGVLADWFLPEAFKTAVYGGRSPSAFKKPLNNYVSFFQAIQYDDGSEVLLLDLIEDEHARDYFEAIEEENYWKSVGRCLRKGISTLSSSQEQRLLLFMLDNGCSYGEAHKQSLLGAISYNRYRQIFNNASRNLKKWMRGKGRRDVIGCGLDYYLNGTKAFYAGGLAAFKSRGFTSNVEAIVLKRLEKLEKETAE